jgi:hypothetical protein
MIKNYFLKLILLFLFSYGFGQEESSLNVKKIDNEINVELAGKLFKKSGDELIKYVNSSIKNSLLVLAGNILLNLNYEEQESANEIRNSALGLTMIFAGTVGHITNIFKIKRPGEYLQKAGLLMTPGKDN